MPPKAEKLRLRITTPDDIKYIDEVDMVVIRSTSGDIGLMPGHAPAAFILDDGVMRIKDGEDELRMAVFGGIAQIRNNRVTVIANDAQWPDDIDPARVETERARIERRLKESKDDLEIQKDQVLMRRTLVQMEVSSYPLIAKRSIGADSAGKAGK